MKPTKEMLAKMKAFFDTGWKVSEQWDKEQCELSEKYPFDQDFTEIIMKIDDWIKHYSKKEYIVKELECVMTEREYRVLAYSKEDAIKNKDVLGMRDHAYGPSIVSQTVTLAKEE